MHTNLVSTIIPVLLAITVYNFSCNKTIPSPPTKWEDTRFSPNLLNISHHLMNCISFMKHPKRASKHHLSYIFRILLLISSDCHPNPGPPTPKYPCGVCGRAVRWSKTVRSVACTECEKWYHINCLGMNTAMYEPLEATDISWYCCSCGIPNFHSSLFTEFDLSDNINVSTETSTKDHSLDTSDISFTNPVSTSSPRKGKHQPITNPINKKIRILNTNLQSMKSKKEEFWSLLEQSDPEIILASETWLNPSITEAEILPPNYKFAARKDRSKSSHRGVAIITKDNIDASEIPLDTQTEMVAASIPSKNAKPIIVCSIYRPTDNNTDYSKHMCNTIKDLHVKHRDNILWIGGDANLPDINWKNDEIKGHQYPVFINQAFIDIFREVGCQQIIDFPTRQNNTLDIFATNRPSLVLKCSALPGLSDHDIVLTDTNIVAQRRRPIRRLIYLWSKADLKEMSKNIGQYCNTLREQHENVPINTLWNTFRSVCTAAINKYVPSKYTSTRYSQPWCTNKIKRHSRAKKRAHTKARKSNKKNDWDRYHRLQKASRDACRSAHNDYINQMISDDNTNKKFYSYIKSKKSDSSGIAPLWAHYIQHHWKKLKYSTASFLQYSLQRTWSIHHILASHRIDRYQKSR